MVVERLSRGALTHHPTTSQAESAVTRTDEVPSLTGERTATLVNFLKRPSDSDRSQLSRVIGDQRN